MHPNCKRLQNDENVCDGARAVSTGQLLVDVGANLRWVGVPLGLPVAVYLPVGAGEAVVVGFAPLADCVVRGAKAAIGAEMCCRCHGARYAGASWLADHGCDFDLYQP